MSREDCYSPDPTFINGLNQAINNLDGQPGTILEFGVYGGRTLEYLAIQLLDRMNPMSKLYGFDSFKGIAKETEGVWRPDRHGEGMMSLSAEYVVKKISDLGIKVGIDERFHLVSGFFCDSLTPDLAATIYNLAFVNIDVDIHSSTVELLEWITPMLRVGTILFFDDWADPIDVKIRDDEWGEHLAFRQYREKHPNIVFSEHDINFINQRWFEVESL